MSPRIDVRSILNPVSENVQSKPVSFVSQKRPLHSSLPTDVSSKTPRVVYNGYHPQTSYHTQPSSPQAFYGKDAQQPRLITYPPQMQVQTPLQTPTQIHTETQTQYPPYHYQSYPQYPFYSPTIPTQVTTVTAVAPPPPPHPAPPIYYVHQYPARQNYQGQPPLIQSPMHLRSQPHPHLHSYSHSQPHPHPHPHPYSHPHLYSHSHSYPLSRNKSYVPYTYGPFQPVMTSSRVPISRTTPTITPNTTVSGPVRRELEYVSWENKRSSKSWTTAEDELLRHLKEVEHRNWIEIATHFPDRTTNGCQFRWRRIAGKIKQKNSKSKIQVEQEGSQQNDSIGEGNNNNNDISSSTELL